MAFPSSFLTVSLTISVFAVMVCPAHSLTCSSQKLNTTSTYDNCTDLPSLNAYLHYSLDASNSSLSIAFIATPAKPSGWISWAINPNGTGMIGAQALVAFESNGSVAIKTYDLASYKNITESKLSFDVWDLKAESNKSTGNFTLFATVKLPLNSEKVNQVWQVGPSVTDDGRPNQHAFLKQNLESKGTLRFAQKTGGSSSPSSPSSSAAAASHSPVWDFRFGMVALAIFWLGFKFVSDL